MITCKASVMLLLLISLALKPISTRFNFRTASREQLLQQAPLTIGSSRQPQLTVAALADGNYQFCSQPNPRDWRDGAGVCFNFVKNNQGIDGYYGYPHSDSFVCVRGQVTENKIVGKALALSWPGQTWFNLSPTEVVWDIEGHLKLNQGEIRRHSGRGELQERWIAFKTAKLDISNFHRYDAPRMKPASELCDWD